MKCKDCIRFSGCKILFDRQQDYSACDEGFEPKETVCVKCKHYQEFNGGYWLCYKFFGKNRFECDSFESKDEWISIQDKTPPVNQKIWWRDGWLDGGMDTFDSFVECCHSKYICGENKERDRLFTHWQPLPEKKKFTALPFSAECTWRNPFLYGDSQYMIMFKDSYFDIGSIESEKLRSLLKWLNELWLSARDKKG